jgi:hypothetical protein
VTSGGLTESLGGTRVSEPISKSEVVNDALSVVGLPNSTWKRDESHVTERSATRVGRGRWQAKAGRKRRAARRVRMMKVDQFA